jgi:hypothetical protein
MPPPLVEGVRGKDGQRGRVREGCGGRRGICINLLVSSSLSSSEEREDRRVRR